MEEKRLENIDIEKNRALFAYEMTEVILKLKGEFATVFEKDTHYDEYRVSEEKLKVRPVSVKEVELAEARMTLPQVGKVEPVVIPEIQVLPCQAAVPEVPGFAPVPVPEVAVAAPAFQVPETANIQAVSIPQAQVTAVGVTLPKVVPAPVFAPREQQVAPVRVTLPEVVQRAVVQIPVLPVTPLQIWQDVPELPQVAVQDVVLTPVKVAVPQVQKVHFEKPRQRKAKAPAAPEIEVPQIPVVTIPKVALQQKKVALPKYEKPAPVKPAGKALKTKTCEQVQIPGIPCFEDTYKAPPVRVQKPRNLPEDTGAEVCRLAQELLKELSGEA